MPNQLHSDVGAFEEHENAKLAAVAFGALFALTLALSGAVYVAYIRAVFGAESLIIPV